MLNKRYQAMIAIISLAVISANAHSGWRDKLNEAAEAVGAAKIIKDKIQGQQSNKGQEESKKSDQHNSGENQAGSESQSSNSGGFLQTTKSGSASQKGSVKEFETFTIGGGESIFEPATYHVRNDRVLFGDNGKTKFDVPPSFGPLLSLYMGSVNTKPIGKNKLVPYVLLMNESVKSSCCLLDIYYEGGPKGPRKANKKQKAQNYKNEIPSVGNIYGLRIKWSSGGKSYNSDGTPASEFDMPMYENIYTKNIEPKILPFAKKNVRKNMKNISFVSKVHLGEYDFDAKGFYYKYSSNDQFKPYDGHKKDKERYVLLNYFSKENSIRSKLKNLRGVEAANLILFPPAPSLKVERRLLLSSDKAKKLTASMGSDRRIYRLVDLNIIGLKKGQSSVSFQGKIIGVTYFEDPELTKPIAFN